MSNEEEFAIMNKALANFKGAIVQENIEALINRVNYFHISLASQRSCAIDIKKLEILTSTLVNKIKSVGMDQTIHIDVTV